MPVFPGITNVAKPHEYNEKREGRLDRGQMAHVLGIKRQRLAELVAQGRVPQWVEDGRRHYEVDSVMRAVMLAPFPCPLLRVKDGDPEAARNWAWRAIVHGPWNIERAPSTEGWRLYLDGKEDLPLRKSLAEASRRFRKTGSNLEAENLKVEEDLPTDSTVEDNGEVFPRTRADDAIEAMGGFRDVAGPLSVGLPEPPEEAEFPAQEEEIGY